MARLPKPGLFKVVERSLLDSGWSFLHLSAPTEHPATYQVYRDERSFRVKIYIWNLSHGGGAQRPADEYRIQITGLPEVNGAQQFIPQIGGKTVILGWWDEVGVFAGFDFSFHSNPLGSSPSIQIREDALRAAHTSGFAPHNRGNGELAIAFKPNFIGAYFENLEALHKTGEVPAEIEVLREIGESPEKVADDEIERKVPSERRYALVSTKRALREAGFRDRVLTAYGHQCAMCGIQLKLLDAAHILPVNAPNSTDETRNGVALCTLHHRAFDRSFVTFDKDYKTYVDEDQAKEFSVTGHNGGLDGFRNNIRPLIILPPDKKDHPDPNFVSTANAMRGWAV
ncbi:MAG: HNH endonuclease [Bradyrhizobiaceae bacterium]|nr:HNH endonuclease [Bradyrhizobiaceae bacterium]